MTAITIIKKPVFELAMLWTGKNIEEMTEFLQGDCGPGQVSKIVGTNVELTVAKGTMVAVPGHYVIRHSATNYSVATPEWLEREYNEVIST